MFSTQQDKILSLLRDKQYTICGTPKCQFILYNRDLFVRGNCYLRYYGMDVDFPVTNKFKLYEKCVKEFSITDNMLTFTDINDKSFDVHINQSVFNKVIDHKKLISGICIGLVSSVLYLHYRSL